MTLQTWGTVNAPMEGGISDLVLAPSAFPQLRAVGSCERDEGKPAFICFDHGNYWEDSWKELSDVCFGGRVCTWQIGFQECLGRHLFYDMHTSFRSISDDTGLCEGHTAGFCIHTAHQLFRKVSYECLLIWPFLQPFSGDNSPCNGEHIESAKNNSVLVTNRASPSR